MTTLRFGVVAGPLGPARNVIAIARAAEEAGFELMGLGESQSLWRDVYVGLTLAADATSTLRLGPCVTNVVTRDLAVTTSAIATVDELSGGRAFLGLGTGDSAVLNVGRRPARLADLEAGVTSIRTMLTGQHAIDGDRSMHVRWSTRRVPVFIAAEGPKSLAMAGRVADGVFVSCGLAPSDVRAAEGHIATGAAAAGRANGAVEIWHAARVTVGDTEAEAKTRARTGMASVAHHALRVDPDQKGVPADLVPAVEELNVRYRADEHAAPGDSFNARLVEELGLMPYLLDRYAIVGTPRQCAERLANLERSGIERLLLMFAGSDLDQQVRRWRRDVVPR